MYICTGKDNLCGGICIKFMLCLLNLKWRSMATPGASHQRATTGSHPDREALGVLQPRYMSHPWEGALRCRL